MTNELKTQHRDDELGELLRRLEAPGHRPEFHRELRARLAEEGRAARRRARLRWGVRLAAAAAVVAAVVAVVGLPGANRSHGPAAASAAIVKAHVRDALASMRTLKGVLVADGPTGPERRWRFALDAGGDFRLEGPERGDAIVYDAPSGVVRSAQHSASLGGSTLFYAERRGVAPGPPDEGPPTWLLPDSFAAYVRAALAEGNPAVREIVLDGRRAWRLDVDVAPSAIVPQFSGDHLRLTVDRETGMPVRVVESKDGRVVREERLEELHVNGDLPPATFRLAFPGGAEVMRSDDGFRRTALDRVAGIVGYAPLVPAALPDGYALREVAVAREAAPVGTGGNPPSRMVVSLSYRRGFDQFLVTTRLRGTGSWSDPLAPAPGFADRGEPVTLGRGALAGTAAHVVVAPRAIPHVWAQTDDLVVTVGGDLGRDELLTVARSLTARG